MRAKKKRLVAISKTGRRGQQRCADCIVICPRADTRQFFAPAASVMIEMIAYMRHKQPAASKDVGCNEPHNAQYTP